jgi:hypothetical protein
VWGRQRSQMADGPCADHFQLPAFNLSDGQHQENMTAAPRSFRGNLGGGVKKVHFYTNRLERIPDLRVVVAPGTKGKTRSGR